jgi:hypothetical protein
MKLTIATTILLFKSSVRGFTTSLPRTSSSLHAIPDNDPYAPLYDKLLSTSSNVDSDSEKLLNILSSTFEAANNAVVASVQISPREIPPFALEAQSRLTAVEQAMHDVRISPSNDADVDWDALYSSLEKVLDASIRAADLAAHSSSEAVHALVDLNMALSHSMGTLDMTTLLPNVGGMIHSPWDGATLSSVDWNDAGLQSLVNAIDRKLDNLSLEISSETAGLLVGYGIVAFLVGYAQNMGVEEYKINLRRKMEDGTFDVEEVSDILFLLFFYVH